MFTRDLVVFDIESTGLNMACTEIIQIAGIRLNKNTLEEVSRFSSYIQPKHWDNWLPEAMEVNKISTEALRSAPLSEQILADFEKHFPPSEVLLTAYNAWFDMGWIRQAYENLGKRSPYEFHCFDIWGLAYLYWGSGPRTKINPKKPIGFGLSDMADLLGITTAGTFHDAITDVEVEAEVLRRLMAKIKFA